MAKHHLTLTHCAPLRAIGEQDGDNDDDPNTGTFYCFACGARGMFTAVLTPLSKPQTAEE